MDSQRILLIQGHPDAIVPHQCRALADAHAQGIAPANEIPVGRVDRRGDEGPRSGRCCQLPSND